MASSTFSPPRCGSSEKSGKASTQLCRSTKLTKRGSTSGLLSANWIAISSTSDHLRLMTCSFAEYSVPFGHLIDGVPGDFYHQILLIHHSLTRQPRIRLQPPGLVQHIVFQLVGWLQRSETLANHHVTGRAGTGLLTGMLDVDTVAQRDIEHGFARLRFDHRPFRAVLGVGQKDHLRHVYSSISLRLRPANAALTVASRRRAAKASVTWVKRLVCCSMARPSLPAISSRNCWICASIARRSSASSKRSPSACKAVSTASSRRWASTCCSRNTRATLSSPALRKESCNMRAISPSVKIGRA